MFNFSTNSSVSMTEAYILITTDTDKTSSILKELKKKDCIEEIHEVGCNFYDFLARIRTSKDKELVKEELMEINGIRALGVYPVRTDKNGPIGFRKDPNTGKIVYSNPSI